MKRINITIRATSGKISSGPVPLTDTEAAEWLQKHKSKFGKEAYSYDREKTPLIPAVYKDGEELFDDEGEPFDPPVYDPIEVSPEIPATFETILVPAEYEVSYEDLTAEVNAEVTKVKTKSDLKKLIKATDFKNVKTIAQAVNVLEKIVQYLDD